MFSSSVFSLIVLSLINTNIVNASKVAMYGQCGGINHRGATECVEGATCVSQNPYYYQCTYDSNHTPTILQPTSYLNHTSTSTTSCSTTTDTSSGKIAMWGQCGGINYRGETECVKGATCVSQNPYYYQCTYDTHATPPPSPPTTTSATIKPTTPPTPTPHSNSTSKAIPQSSKVPLYYQCGGINYKGATECADGATCVSQNPYYYQCTYEVYSIDTGATKLA